MILYHTHTHTTGQMIIKPPVNATAALGTNATFTCRGDAQVYWKITGTQAITQELVSLFAKEQVYVPLHEQGFSELIITATEGNNFTRTIQCLVASSITSEPVESEMVRLLVYGECEVQLYDSNCLFVHATT